MKTLITYYSRSGNTKKAAEKIQKKLKCDIDEIYDLKKRKGVIGWITGGRDALMKKGSKIKTSHDPGVYDLIIIGTPVWAGTMAPAVRTYLTKNKAKKIAFFCTMAGNDEQNTFKQMKEISKTPITTLAIKPQEIQKTKKIDLFCEGLMKDIKK